VTQTLSPECIYIKSYLCALNNRKTFSTYFRHVIYTQKSKDPRFHSPDMKYATKLSNAMTGITINQYVFFWHANEKFISFKTRVQEIVQKSYKELISNSTHIWLKKQ